MWLWAFAFAGDAHAGRVGFAFIAIGLIVASANWGEDLRADFRQNHADAETAAPTFTVRKLAKVALETERVNTARPSDAGRTTAAQEEGNGNA